MSDKPLVSVIISAYNVEKYIEEAVRSILNQEYENLEIVIADDGSSDRTRIIIDLLDDSRIKRFHNESNMGLLHTWNKLLPLTKGSYITFQDGDDVSLPGRIEHLVSFLESNREIGLCGTNFIRYFGNWGLYQVSDYPLKDVDIRAEFKVGNVPFNGTRVMIRREVYHSVGGFREFFKGLAAEDFDWILRISEKYQVANIPDVLYEYRYFKRSASKNSLASPVERIFVSKIIFFLADQRDKYGYDSIDKNELDRIQDFLKPYYLQLEKDKTNYLRYNRVFSNALANKDFVAVASLFINRIIQYPFSIRDNTHDLYRLFSGFLRTFFKSVVFKLTGRAKYSSLTS